MHTAVVFDLASLVNLDELLDEAQHVAAEDAHVPWSLELAHALSGQPLDTMASLIAKRGRDTAGRGLHDLELELRTKRVGQALHARIESLIHTRRVREQPDAANLLDELHQCGLPIGVVSLLSYDEAIRCLRAADLCRFLDAATGYDWPADTPPSTNPYGSMIGTLERDTARSVAVVHTASAAAAARQADLLAVADPHAHRRIDADAHLASYRNVSVPRLLTLAERRRPA